MACLNFAGTGSRILLPAVSSCRRVKPSRKIALNSNGEVNCRELARRPWLKLTVCLCYVVLLGVNIFSHEWTCGAAIIEFVWMSALCTTPRLLLQWCDMPTINRLAYSPSFLKSLSNSNYPFQPYVLLQSTLDDIVICRKRTKTCKRGCRGGMNLIPRSLLIPRKKPSGKTLKRPPQQPPVNERGVNPANLTQIKPVASASSHRHFKCEFPTFFLSNAQSLSCCYTTKSLLMWQPVWQWLQNLGSAQTYQTMHVQIDGYDLFSKSRSDIANITDRGGGVAVYVISQITASDIPEILVPNDLECVCGL